MKKNSEVIKSLLLRISGGRKDKRRETFLSLPLQFSTIERDKLLVVVQNLLAGLASSIALIPEASTFAITAGLNPLVGLGSTVVLGTFSGCFGGRPGIVSGSSATVAMILRPICEKHGHLVLSLTVILGGFFQLALGCTRAGKYIRVVPQPVMLGFVNGLAIKVIKAQIPHFQHPHGVWLKGDALKWHTILVVVSALIIDILPRYIKIIPSPLAALGLATVLANRFDLPVPRLIDMVGPEAFQGGIDTLKQALFPFRNIENASISIFPPFKTVLTSENLLVALPTAIEMAVVGLLQSLLTLQIIDSKTHTKGKNTQESIAQGLGNIASGFMGGMGGSALLGQSLVNVNSGGTGRLSSISVAVFVLCGITFFAPILGGLPVAALVGLMLAVAQHTFSWGMLQSVMKGQVPTVDIFIIVMVTLTTACVNMAVAVALGVLASALRFAWQASCNMSAHEGNGSSIVRIRNIRIQGPLFFGSTITFEKLCEPSAEDREVAKKLRIKFENKTKRKRKKGSTKTSGSSSNSIGGSAPPPDEAQQSVILKTGRETAIDFSDSQVWDHAAIMAIEKVALKHHNLGVKLRLRHLSPDCREKLMESSDIDKLSTELAVDTTNDPSYLVGEDPN